MLGIELGIEVTVIGFFSFAAQENRRADKGLNAAKVMKPYGELNRSQRVALYWILLGSGAWRGGAGNSGVGVLDLRLGTRR